MPIPQHFSHWSPRIECPFKLQHCLVYFLAAVHIVPCKTLKHSSPKCPIPTLKYWLRIWIPLTPSIHVPSTATASYILQYLPSWGRTHAKWPSTVVAPHRWGVTMMILLLFLVCIVSVSSVTAALSACRLALPAWRLVAICLQAYRYRDRLGNLYALFILRYQVHFCRQQIRGFRNACMHSQVCFCQSGDAR